MRNHACGVTHNGMEDGGQQKQNENEKRDRRHPVTPARFLRHSSKILRELGSDLHSSCLRDQIMVV